MSEISRFADEFGGVRPLADHMSKVLGKRVAPSTVQYWVEVGYVPQKRIGDILKAAQAAEKKVTREALYQPVQDSAA